LKKSILQVISFSAKKLVLFMLGPWILAVPFAVAIILFLPPISKYKAAFTSKEYQPGTCFFYTDLDGDGITEKVGVTKNSLENSSLKLYKINGGLIEQVNFRHGLTSYPPNSVFGDSDHDGFQEIFLFTATGDSVFLGYCEPFGPEKLALHEWFVDRIRRIGDTVDYGVSSESRLLKDMNRDGYDDLIFFISARYSVAPRQVYVYDIHHDSIYKSGSFGSNLNELKVADINGDGYFEVVGNNQTRGNTRDTMKLMYLTPVHG
jgi:hypothetical protein